MIHKFGQVLASITEQNDIQAGLPNGRYVQAVPLPFVDGLFGRLRDCWEIISGRAHAFSWPEHGEVELATRSWRHRHASQVISRSYERRTINSEQMHIMSEWSGYMMERPGHRSPAALPDSDQ